MNRLTVEIQRDLFARYKRITGMRFSESIEDDNNQGNLYLDLADNLGGVIQLKFIAVRNLQINTGAYDCINVSGLEIESLSDAQWPGVELWVHSEDDLASISFYCRDAAMAR